MRRVTGEGWQERGQRRRAEEGAGTRREGSAAEIPVLLGEIGVQKRWVALGGGGIAHEGLGAQRG